MSYTITVGAGYIVKTPASGIPVVVNSANVVTEGGIESIRKVSVPVSVATPTGYTYYVDFYIVLNLVDGREETIYMASVTNQPTWTNDLAGVNTAIADIYGSFVNGGGGGGGQVNSVVAGTGISVDNTDPVNPVVSATGLVIYTAYLSQDGTTDPATATVGVNNIGSIVWTRGASKECIGTLSGAFPAGTVVMVSTGKVNAEYCFPIECKAVPSDTVSFLMYSPSEGDTMDGWDASVLIIVP